LGGLGYRVECAAGAPVIVMFITQAILLWPPPICPGFALFSLGFRAIFRQSQADHDAIQLNRIMISSLCLSMIFSENRFPLFRIML
jgi:hypothetical protein